MTMEFETLRNENESELSASAYALLGIIRDYERVTCLSHPENPVLEETKSNGSSLQVVSPSTRMINKANVALRIFQNKADNGEYNNQTLEKMSVDLNILTLRLANMILHLNATREVVLLPSRRNYLKVGKEHLMYIFENMVEYSRIGDNFLISQNLESLKSIATEADKSCEGLMEYRIVNILIVLITLLPDDVQSISYLSQLMLFQANLVGGEN